jgi:hypothetical protein
MRVFHWVPEPAKQFTPTFVNRESAPRSGASGFRERLELRDRLLHPAEDDARTLALERHRHDPRSCLEPDLAEL